MGNLYTSYFKKLPENIKNYPKMIHYSIARGFPQWLNLNIYSIGTIMSFAPSYVLLSRYLEKPRTITWEEYEQAYRQESSQASISDMETINDLLLMGADICMYCHESKGNCHRHIRAKMFEERFGITVKEL